MHVLQMAAVIDTQQAIFCGFVANDARRFAESNKFVAAHKCPYCPHLKAQCGWCATEHCRDCVGCDDKGLAAVAAAKAAKAAAKRTRK